MMTWERIARRLALAGQQAIELFAATVAVSVSYAVHNRKFTTAFAATLLFYLPALKSGSDDAGFLYGGDVLGFFWPSLVKTHSLISSFNFTAIDFSQFNGSADFFLTANFFACHPLFVLYSLFTPQESTSIRDIGRLLVVVLAIHSFLACYFALKLLTRFYFLEFSSAAFAAVAFAFSVLMVNSLGEPQFVFCASIVPWAAYAALSFQEKPSVPGLLHACLPVLTGYLGGYIPMGVACIALASVLVAARLILLDDAGKPLRDRARSLAVSMVPFVSASLLAAPYLFSVYLFLQDSPSAQKSSLYFSAHQFAELPQTLLRLLSFHYEIPGPFYEFTVTWGLIAVTIVGLFVVSAKTIEDLSAREWTIFKVFAVIYFATVFSIYGQYSVVSDLVFYLVPQVGSMHIYQRFLLPAQLLFGVMIALMLKSLVTTRPMAPARFALAILGVATIAAAFIVARNPTLTQDLGINNYIVFELFLCVLFVGALMMPGKTFVFGVALVLCSLPTLERMYRYSSGGSTLQAQQKTNAVALDEGARQRLVSYLKRFSDKDLIKYVDVTPLWTKEGSGVEIFPKSFPYLVLRELRLSSYGGFNFYLSTRADYMRSMPVLGRHELTPDWERVANTGADFLVAREPDLKRADLMAMIGEKPGKDIHRLPNDVVIVPLRDPASKDAEPAKIIDNGYFRISPAGKGHAPKKLENIALHKVAQQSSTAGGEAGRAVDGNTNGLFSAGSVTHTGVDPNAWFEIDLGAVEPIDSVRVWNRTDCCGPRLHDFWLVISETPFSKNDTVSSLRTRKGTWSKVNFTPTPKITIKTPGVHGRYVRIQLGGKQPLDGGILSLAEVEVFRSDSSQVAGPAPQPSDAPAIKVLNFTTNNANYLRLDLNSSGPATVEYLLWHHPKLNYYLNGERATVIERDGLRTIDVPSGRNLIEIRYRHWPLMAFWTLYALFGIACVLALIVVFVRAGTRRQPMR